MLSYSLLVPSNVCMGLIEVCVCVCVCVYGGSFPNKQSCQLVECVIPKINF